MRKVHPYVIRNVYNPESNPTAAQCFNSISRDRDQDATRQASAKGLLDKIVDVQWLATVILRPMKRFSKTVQYADHTIWADHGTWFCNIIHC